MELMKKKKGEDEKSAAQYDRMLNVVGEKIRQIVGGKSGGVHDQNMGKSNSLDLLKDLEEKINEMIEEVGKIGEKDGGVKMLSLEARAQNIEYKKQKKEVLIQAQNDALFEKQKAAKARNAYVFVREGRSKMPRSEPEQVQKKTTTPPKDPEREAQLKYLGDLDALLLEA